MCHLPPHEANCGRVYHIIFILDFSCVGLLHRCLVYTNHSVVPELVVDIMFWRLATMVHAVGSAVQLSVGASDGSGDQVAAASNNFSASLGRSQAETPVITNIE